jgi:predicted ester cyclase
MAAKDNKVIAKKLFDLLPHVVDRNNFDALDEVLHADVKIHGTVGEYTGLADFKDAVRQQAQVQDENSIVIHNMVAEDDYVAVTYTHALRFTGDFLGMRATGRKATFTGTATCRIAGDKIVDAWFHEDVPAMTAQLASA